MRLAKKETAVVASPIKKVTLVDKEEVCINVGNLGSIKNTYHLLDAQFSNCMHMATNYSGSENN